MLVPVKDTKGGRERASVITAVRKVIGPEIAGRKVVERKVKDLNKKLRKRRMRKERGKEKQRT